MDVHPRRNEGPKCHCFLDPEHHVVTGSACIVAEIMVQAEFLYLPGLEQRDDVIRPIGPCPSCGCLALIVQKYTHGNRHLSSGRRV